MPNYEQTIVGYNRLQNKLRRIAADKPEIGDEPLYEFMQEQRAELKSTPYPPKRPAQRYRRTGQLANKFAVVKASAGQYTMVNNAKGKSGYYAGYVIGKKQAWMHKNRWWQAHKILQDNMYKLTAKLTEVYMKIWKD